VVAGPDVVTEEQRQARQLSLSKAHSLEQNIADSAPQVAVDQIYEQNNSGRAPLIATDHDVATAKPDQAKQLRIVSVKTLLVQEPEPLKAGNKAGDSHLAHHERLGCREPLRNVAQDNFTKQRPRAAARSVPPALREEECPEAGRVQQMKLVFAARAREEKPATMCRTSAALRALSEGASRVKQLSRVFSGDLREERDTVPTPRLNASALEACPGRVQQLRNALTHKAQNPK
jgi:hypothetical protein